MLQLFILLWYFCSRTFILSHFATPGSLNGRTRQRFIQQEFRQEFWLQDWKQKTVGRAGVKTRFQSKCNNWIPWQLLILVYSGESRYLCCQDWGWCLPASPSFLRAALRSEEGWSGNGSLLSLLGYVLAWDLLFWAVTSLLLYQLWGLMTWLAPADSCTCTSSRFFSVSLIYFASCFLVLIYC